MKKVFTGSFVKVLRITVVSALIIVGGLYGISDTRAAAGNFSVPYPVNVDAIEETYPLDSIAKEKLLSNGFIVLEDYKYDDINGVPPIFSIPYNERLPAVTLDCPASSA